jgi:hypothetical protein
LLLRALFAAIFFVCVAGSCLAQSQDQLPHAWNEAVFALADKIAAALAPSHTFSLEVKDISSAAPVDLAGALQTLDTDLALRGGRSVPSASADTLVQVTISQNVEGYVLVADIHRGETQQVAIVPVAGTEDVAPQPSPEPGIQRKIVWQQTRPLLDFAQGAMDARRNLWYFLEPDALVVYEFDDGAQILRDTKPISKLYTSRDLRGRLLLTDATHVTAYVGGIRCDGLWNPSFAVDCRENSGQLWPMGTVSWTFDARRNNFSGTVNLSNGLAAKFPAFFSAASPSSEASGQSTSRWVVAGIDGTAQLFAGTADPASTFSGWGSDILSVAPACGSAWQLLVTGAGDTTQPDSIQLYEIRDSRAISIGQPVEFPGPILALWPTEDGKSARVVSRNLQSGLYEASIISVSCGN